MFVFFVNYSGYLRLRIALRLKSGLSKSSPLQGLRMTFARAADALGAYLYAIGSVDDPVHLKCFYSTHPLRLKLPSPNLFDITSTTLPLLAIEPKVLLKSPA